MSMHKDTPLQADTVGRLNTKAETATINGSPALSVVIASYNRAEQLRSCLAALAQQTQSPTDYEVVVVVDGSTDATAQMLADLAPAYQLRVLQQSNQGQAVALNVGIQVARGQYCLLLDDDIVVAPQLVAEHLRVQRAYDGVVGLGHLKRTLPPHADGFARSLQHWLDKHYQRFSAGGDAPSFMDCYSGNLSAPRAALLAVGGFAADLPRSYDVELGYRLQAHGLRCVYIPDAIGDEDFRKGFREITRDAELAGMASVELYHRHPAMLPYIGLGAFAEASFGPLYARRLLLAMPHQDWLLQLLSHVLGHSPYAHLWFAFLHTYYFWRGVRRAVPRDRWRQYTSGTVLLLYHAFGTDGEPPSRYIVPQRRLRYQMAWLKWRRYHVLSLDEFLEYRRTYRFPPARSVVITIDDGYADNNTVAFPIFRRYGFPATIFVVSSAVGTHNWWDNTGALSGRSLLTWQAIHEMRPDGITFGAHTRTHPVLPTCNPERCMDELEGSRLELEHALKQPIRTFAYPYGEFDNVTLDAAEKAGFWAACSVRRGLNTPVTPVYALRRTTIHGTDSLVHFVVALHCGRTTLPLRQLGQQLLDAARRWYQTRGHR